MTIDKVAGYSTGPAEGGFGTKHAVLAPSGEEFAIVTEWEERDEGGHFYAVCSTEDGAMKFLSGTHDFDEIEAAVVEMARKAGIPAA